MSTLATGPGLFASFNNTNPPADLSPFQDYLDAGLKRLCVFTFIPNAQLPTTPEWYTTKEGNQPQGLDTCGTGTVEAWASLFQQFQQAGVQVGFTFGGEGATDSLGTMLDSLNSSSEDFSNFMATLESYNVSYLHFDIEGSWATPSGFSEPFQTFAENVSSASNGAMAIEIGASAPIGTVDGSSSQSPAYLTPGFVAENNIFFNVYTYYTLEVENTVSSNTPWIPSNTNIPPSHILFSLTCNNTSPAPSGQLVFDVFMDDFPDSDLLSTVKNQNYLGFTTWVWWQTSTYPSDNCLALFQASVT